MRPVTKSPASVLITGASSGLGAALARAYAATGCRLSLFGRNPARLDAVAEACRTAGATVASLAIEVTDRASMAAAMRAADATSPLDLIIANAGISGAGSQAGPAERAAEIMRVNVEGVINTIEPVLPAMIARGHGHLALMSSLAGFRGMPSARIYCASKAAVRVYGEGLRARLASQGIRVSIICPGFIETPLTAANPFPMPLLMPAEQAANRIKAGLARGRPLVAFPRRLYLLVRALQLLPAGIADPLLARAPDKE